MNPVFKKARTETQPPYCYDNSAKFSGITSDRIHGQLLGKSSQKSDCNISYLSTDVHSHSVMPGLDCDSFTTMSSLSTDHLKNTDLRAPLTSLPLLEHYLCTEHVSLSNQKTDLSCCSDFITIMNLCSSIVDEVTCPFQDQSLLIFDQKVNTNSKTAVTGTQGSKYPVAHSIGALVAMERSLSHWQLYLGTKF